MHRENRQMADEFRKESERVSCKIVCFRRKISSNDAKNIGEKMTDEKEFYTVDEFAKKIRVSPMTVRRGLKSGKFQFFRTSDGLKSSYRIPASEATRICEFIGFQSLEI